MRYKRYGSKATEFRRKSSQRAYDFLIVDLKLYIN